MIDTKQLKFLPVSTPGKKEYAVERYRVRLGSEYVGEIERTQVVVLGNVTYEGGGTVVERPRRTVDLGWRYTGKFGEAVGRQRREAVLAAWMRQQAAAEGQLEDEVVANGGEAEQVPMTARARWVRWDRQVEEMLDDQLAFLAEVKASIEKED